MEGNSWPTKRYYSGPEGAHRRAVYRACGFTDEDLSRPLIAVVNTPSEVCPGHAHLRALADSVKAGIWQGGGTAMEFCSIAPCPTPALGLDGMNYDLPTRDLVSFDIEAMVGQQMFDGMAMLASCDKIVPAMLLAAARIDLPSIIVTGGPMLPGEYKGSPVTLSDLDEAVFGKLPFGLISDEEIFALERAVCPTAGACPVLGTANTMQCLAEAAGMALPMAATSAAVSAEKLAIAKRSGMRVVAMVKDGLRPRLILTEKALRNMIASLMALGGSANALIHILALAQELGLGGRITLSVFDEISRSTPCIANVRPNGPYFVTDLHRAGGMPALLRALRGLIFEDCLTALGIKLGEQIDLFSPQSAPHRSSDVIRDLSNPISRDGGIAILYGSIAPEGSVLRKSAASMTGLRHKGTGRVFNSCTDAMEALRRGAIKRGDVVVVRYAGPRGGPGMPDIYPVLAQIVGMGLGGDVAVITDGRFSGFARGIGVCQISPEAAMGGPLAALEDGDIIDINVAEGRLDALGEDEIKKRLESWQRPEKKKRGGVLGLYEMTAEPAYKGARFGQG